MEISGSSGNEKQYSAIAFALQPEMKNADLYYCTGKDLKSGVIQQQYETPETLGSLPVSFFLLYVSLKDFKTFDFL